MLDFGNLPSKSHADIQVFTRPSTVTVTQLHPWSKPRGKTMMFAMAIGGGGGGGGGFTGAAASARGGGGGGGSSSITKLLIPLMCVPDRLYVQVGAGGQGVGSGGGTAGSGILSYIFIHAAATLVSGNILIASGAAGATGGGTGTAAAVGAAGAAGTIFASSGRCDMGIFQSIAGNVGFAGGAVAGAAGTNATVTVTGIGTGGAGGAGTTSADFAGGGFTAVTDSFLSQYRPQAPAAGSNNGAGGIALEQLLWTYGGCGGSSSNAGVGGNGGNGIYGSGGGGGGGGTTGGRGGNGGDGIVIIICW